jgi:hypothetical protein
MDLDELCLNLEYEYLQEIPTGQDVRPNAVITKRLQLEYFVFFTHVIVMAEYDFQLCQ